LLRANLTESMYYRIRRAKRSYVATATAPDNVAVRAPRSLMQHAYVDAELVSGCRDREFCAAGRQCESGLPIYGAAHPLAEVQRRGQAAS
jgi:hypothetical protein